MTRTTAANMHNVCDDRLEWFRNARFGMFIHWGLYALLGRSEWVLNRERIGLDEYVKLADRFEARHYDPHAWAALAAEAGMKYMVLTTKHHEGFCLWDSGVCSFNAVNSAARRDLVGDYVQAVRRAGLKVGLYYSLGDWYHPDWSAGWRGDDAARERFMDYTHDLVRELMTDYGRIDILWYDLPQGYSPQQWRADQLNAMARRLQPRILINNRAMTVEDFATLERHIHPAPPERMWEACMTLNDNWGYCAADHDWKSPRDVAIQLAQVAAGQGNLLLNVGPDGDGRIPEPAPTILRRVGQWLAVNGESIYGTDRTTISFNLWGPTTTRGCRMYLHLQRYFGPEVVIGGLTNTIRHARLLATGQPLSWEQQDHRTFLRGLPPDPPDDLLTVVELELDRPPDQDISRIIGDADRFPDLP